MTAMSIAAFVLSWSPYAIVSIVATIRGTNVLTPDLAEIPDLLAKAWVIYNPIVYTAMNERFRKTLQFVAPSAREQIHWEKKCRPRWNHAPRMRA